ncbi:hypothetical protein OSG_eHP2_00130 [environmental Halophage eHP-2]|nr:hypothetical protein OSG_eHP2_00130 [environmental Halophage eHP-2]
MTENSTALLFDILDTATQGDPDSAANNIALLNQLLTATDNDPSNISANEIGLLTEILSIITDQPPDVAANEIAVLTEILSAIQTQNPQVRENKIALLNEIAANSQSLVDALNPVTLPVAASNLVAWYPFRSGTGEDITAGDSNFGDTTDYSAVVNGATFQSSGGVTDIQTGANSGAFDFDGVDDDLQPQNDSGLNFGTDSFSISLALSLDVLGNDEGIIEKNAGNGLYQLFKRDDSDINFRLSDGSASNFPRLSFSTTSVKRVTGVRDAQASELKLFVGSRSASESVTTILDVDNTGDLLFGFDTTNPAHLDGVLDDIRFYDTALTQSQHDEIRSNTIP